MTMNRKLSFAGLVAAMAVPVIFAMIAAADANVKTGNTRSLAAISVGESSNTDAISVPLTPSTGVVISEFRTRGPNGASDEFIELYNLSSGSINIGGWKINGSNSLGTVSTRVTISTGTSLPAH